MLLVVCCLHEDSLLPEVCSKKNKLSLGNRFSPTSDLTLNCFVSSKHQTKTVDLKEKVSFACSV